MLWSRRRALVVGQISMNRLIGILATTALLSGGLGAAEIQHAEPARADGTTWTSQSSGTTSSLSGVSCPSDTVCYAVGSDGAIVATTNGGSTWTSQISGTGRILRDVSCPSETVCFAVGYNIAEDDAILATTNGGSTWTLQHSEGVNLSGISCPSTSVCYAVGYSPTPIPNPTRIGTVILATTDGGNSWSQQTSPTDIWPFSVSCPSTTACYAVGGDKILATTNGGSSWLPQPFAGTDWLGSVSCPSTDVCYAVGNSGTIAATTDGGTTWLPQDSGTEVTLSAVSCTWTMTCWAVGDAGTIVVTTNGGSTWTTQTSGTTQYLSSVSCPSIDFCWGVGQAGTILAGTGPPPPADPPPDPDELDDPLLQNTPLGEDQIDDFDAVTDISALSPQLEQAFGARYGESWIDRADLQSVLRVSVVDGTNQDQATLDSLTGSNPRIKMVSVNYSYATLQSWADEVVSLMDSQELSTHLVAVDPSLNKVVVKTDRLDADVALEIADRIPPDAILIQVGFAMQEQNATRSTYPPYEGGLSIDTNKPRVNVCTAGFTVIKGSSYFGTTAGHCGRVNDRVTIGGRSVGTIDRSYDSETATVDADVASYRIPSSAATKRLFVADNKHRTVTGEYANKDLKMGTKLCFQGAKSGNDNCGDVNSVNGTITIAKGGKAKHTWCVRPRFGGPSQPGDSGGPVYHVNSNQSAKAAGFLFAGDDTDWCFSTLGYALPRLGAVLFTG